MRREDLLIVGGGPAGAAAAIALQRAGHAPLLLERTAAPADALCGGFLSWATVARLATLGVDAFALGAHPVTRLRLVAGRRVVEAALPGRAAGLSRRMLDAALLAQVHRVERGVAVRAAAPGRVRTDDGEIACGTLFLATGKHDLRGLARPRDATGRDPALGLRLRLPAAPDLAGVIELHPFDRGYAGIVVQEDGMANICMAVRRSRLTAAGGVAALLDALATEVPALGERMAARDAVPVQAVAQVPYGWRTGADVPGLFRLGDQAAVIPSLAGEGIDIALAGGIAAADALAAGRPFQSLFAARLARPLAVAGLLKTLAERPAGAAAMAQGLALWPGAAGLLGRITRV